MKKQMLRISGSQAALTRQCWAPAPAQRPSFIEVVTALEDVYASITGAHSGGSDLY